MEAELFIHFISSGPGRAAQLRLLNACAVGSLPLGRSTLHQGLLPFPSHLISIEWLGEVGAGVSGFFSFYSVFNPKEDGVISTASPPLRAATALKHLSSCALGCPCQGLRAGGTRGAARGLDPTHIQYRCLVTAGRGPGQGWEVPWRAGPGAG